MNNSITYPIVKYSKPQEGEEDLKFYLLEDNGDRVLIKLIDDNMTLSPTSVISKDEIKFVY